MRRNSKRKRPQRTELWQRIERSPECRAWLEAHRGEVSRNGHRPNSVQFFREIGNHAFAPILEYIKDKLSASDQAVADLMLSKPVREIALELNISRDTAYNLVNMVKRRARTAWEAERAAYILDRDATSRALDTHPQHIAHRTHKFTFLGTVKHAYCVMLDEREVWVDDTGKAFSEEIQELLLNLNQLTPEFESLETD